VAAKAVGRSRGIGYRPLIAEALLVRAMRGWPGLSAPQSDSAVERGDRARRSTAGSDRDAHPGLGAASGLGGTAWRPTAPLLDGLAVVEWRSRREHHRRLPARPAQQRGPRALGRRDRARARTLLERASTTQGSVTGPGAVELIEIRKQHGARVRRAQSRDALIGGGPCRARASCPARTSRRARAQLIPLPSTTVVSLARGRRFMVASVCRRRELQQWQTGATAKCWPRSDRV